MILDITPLWVAAIAEPNFGLLAADELDPGWTVG